MTMVNKARISVIYEHISSFVEKDIEILRKEFDVKHLQYTGKEDIFKLAKSILETDINVSWFILGYATSAVLLSKFLRKKSIIIAGGFDVVAFPEIDYGLMKDPDRIPKTRFALENADKILAVSKSARDWVSRWIRRDDVAVVYHGFDHDLYIPKGAKENIVLTLGSLINETTIKVKGLETFVKVAELLPEIRFILIGQHDSNIAAKWRKTSPSNVDILDSLPINELIKYYQRAKVYAQLSYQESFGCALAEAMLCECVPVVTNRGAIPEVVGNAGYYAEYGDIKGTAEMITKGLTSTIGRDARNKIISDFPLERRKTILLNIIKEYI